MRSDVGNSRHGATHGILDTSFIVRYLTTDVPELAERAAAVIESDAALIVTDVVLLETAYALTTLYRLPRDLVVDQIIDLISRRNIAVMGLDKAIVIQALRLCRPSGRISFGDALIWAAARSQGSQVVYSFDARFPTGGIEVRQTLPEARS